MPTTFVKPGALVPAKAGRITIHITTALNPDGSVSTATGNFELQLVDAAGNDVRTISGDLVPQLTPAQQQGAVDLMTALRVKANAEAV